MQNYIDAFVAYNTAEYSKAEKDCKAARANLKAAGDPDNSVSLAAKILGVRARDVIAVKDHYRYSEYEIAKWPRVRINICKTDAYKEACRNVKAIKDSIDQCCEREREAKGRNHETSLTRFRRFLRARFGAKPTCTTHQAIAEYMEAIKPVVCNITHD